MRYLISIPLAFLILSAPSGLSQAQMSVPGGSVSFDKDGNFTKATLTYRVPLPPIPGYLPGRPYSAEEISQQTQQLPDGTRINRSRHSGYFYRDSAGRTRTEKQLPQFPILKPGETPMVPEIFDPVAGCIYYFDVANKIAHRVELPQPIRILIPPQGMIIQIAMPPMILPGSGKSPPPPPVGFSEELGTQMVEGIEIHGRRTTTTYAAGTMGNDRPVSTITELWTSPDLNIMISSKISDPRQGETISMLRNISLAEPDAALFQVPPGYRVIDETGPFTITINRVPDTK